MILTEKEAATRRCQEGFAPPHSDNMDSLDVTITHATMIAGGMGAISHVQTFSPSHCIGSRCMAWRFTGATNEFAAPLGYCGKVGKP